MMAADKPEGEISAEKGGAAAGLERLSGAAEAAAPAAKKALPPVHLWEPPFSGDLDMRIARDGAWFYQGSRINREPLVRLFGRILRKDEDGDTYLITPVEKFRIKVDDAPFVGVDLDVAGAGVDQIVEIETNHADRVTLGPEHRLRLVFDASTGQPAPYILIRGRLEARLDRKSFFRLADLAVEHRHDGRDAFGVWSAGVFFPLDAEDR